jgi:hypothetical protein
MKTSIFDRFREAVKVLNGTISPVGVEGYWDVKVIRHDGKVEEKTLRNTVTVTGLNRLAACAVNSAAGVMNAIVVGTQTSGPALTDSQSSFGEVIRKSFVTLGANAQSREWFFGVCTMAGAADSVTSVALASAGITIGTSSLATSFIMNRVNGLGVTLGNSDFLNLTARVRVGSHDVAHST